MAEIEKTIDSQNDLTSFTIIGEVGPIEILKALEQFYEQPTRLALWNFTDANVSSISAETILNLVQSVKRMVKNRSRAKTAITGSEDALYGLVKMFGAFANIEDMPVEIGTFRETEEALQWLTVN